MSNLLDTVSRLNLDEIKLPRRRVLQMMGLGAVGTAGMLLAACGDDDDDDTDDPVTEPGDDEDPIDEDDDDDVAVDDDDAEPADRHEAYARAVGRPEGDPFNPAVGEPRFGGDLQVGSHDEPVLLDAHLNTRSVIQYLNANMCEGLWAWNLDGEPQAALAESHEWNDDSTILTINLRQGVPFHDGHELTSADIEANINRWGSVPLGSEAGSYIDSVDTPDDYTVVVNLNEPFPFLVFRMTVRQASSFFIYSGEQIEALDEPTDDIGVPIGTGPFMFDEWRENQFLRMVRFDDYAGREEPPAGDAGGKVAYLDAITFQWVPDESVRIAGLQTGEYHMVENILPDHFERFDGDADPNVRTRLTLGSWPCVHFNLQQGIMTDLRVRQAFNAAIDVTQVAAALGSEVFFPISPSMVPGEDGPWYSEVGEDVYLEYDPDRARQLLEESDYDGQTIRWLVNPDSDTSYTPGIVCEPMLEEAGFNIELVPLDGATLASYRADPDRMEAFGCGWSYQPDPTLMAAWQPGFPGWWDTEEKNRILREMRMETDFDARYALWEEFQQLYYTELPGIKFCDQNSLILESEQYSGTRYEIIFYYFWNTWLNE
jgi:peptide/nickel transport system substrate-binding protein